MKIGIAIDPWKLPIFKRHLDLAGYSYTVAGKKKDPFLVLTVEADYAHKLQPIVQAAQDECAKTSK